MVDILCPHCEKEIELNDDAKGEFACPYCDGEFEWGMDDEDDDLNYFANEVSAPRNVLIEFDDNPAIRITAGTIFATAMGLYAAFVAFPIIITGLFVSDIESAIGSETGFGAIFILIGFALLVFFITGITFGVLMAKGRLSALITCGVFSVIGLVGTVLGWILSDSSDEECLELDIWSGECDKYAEETFDVPILGIIVWLSLIGMIATMIFVPKFRYQFD
jgi:hypothetical protein